MNTIAFKFIVEKYKYTIVAKRGIVKGGIDGLRVAERIHVLSFDGLVAFRARSSWRVFTK